MSAGDLSVAESSRAVKPVSPDLSEQFWQHVHVQSMLLESTGGKDKILKLIQYGCKIFLNTVALFKQRKWLLNWIAALPQELLKKTEILAKQFSISRKLFRFGRTLLSVYQLRQLLKDKNEFLQVWVQFSNFTCKKR
jgi:hypothetical protein